jgi:hypothetical protein
MGVAVGLLAVLAVVVAVSTIGSLITGIALIHKNKQPLEGKDYIGLVPNLLSAIVSLAIFFYTNITTSAPTVRIPFWPTTHSILYQANWSHDLNGWTAAPGEQGLGWQPLNGELLNDGTYSGGLAPPYQPGKQGVSNYDVQIDMQLPDQENTNEFFAINVRQQFNNNNGYTLAVCRRERNDGLHDRGVTVQVGRRGRVHA